MAGNAIKFGTSGWRGIIARDFTYANVRLAVEAIAGYLLSKKKNPTVLVGHDTRIFSEDFSRAAAEMLMRHGVKPLVAAEATPTPALAHELIWLKADGALNFTASHNPAEYHGLKFSGPDGGPALPEVTRDIEARVAKLAGGKPAAPAPHGTENHFEGCDPRPRYLERLGQLVKFDTIRRAKVKLACDLLHGAGAGYLDRVLADQGIAATVIRANRDVLFDGTGPDVSEENLGPLGVAMKSAGAELGMATDGDADRFGVMDADGSFVQPGHVLALLYDYVVETRGWKLGAARSVATSHLMDAVAGYYGQATHQTPVGFKYVGELIKQDKIALGGEESAGMSIRGHVPEKDGILACLLTAEMVAERRATIAEQLRALFKKIGREYWPLRHNLHLPEDVKARLLERLKGEFKEFVGRRVAKTDRTDGLKLIFEDGAWVLMRLSGTEPLVRVYTEAATVAASQKLAKETERWINE